MFLPSRELALAVAAGVGIGAAAMYLYSSKFGTVSSPLKDVPNCGVSSRKS